jgi:hypothetical protein
VGKKKRRLLSPKFANWRKANGIESKRGVIEIDMSSGQEISEEETVEVVTNTTPEETVEEVVVPTPEPQLQTIQVEEEKVNGLKETKTTRSRKKSTTTTKKETTTKKSTTTRRRRTSKAKTTTSDI